MNEAIILLDTNVVSELMRPKPAQAVLEWFAAHDLVPSPDLSSLLAARLGQMAKETAIAARSLSDSSASPSSEATKFGAPMCFLFVV